MSQQGPDSVAAYVRSLVADEKWKPISGFPSYQVSSHGRIKSGRRILKPATTAGYLHVSLSKGGKSTTARVHVIVCATFWGEAPFDGAIVAHNDGNRKNCRADNLRWASARENQADSKRHLTRRHGSGVFGAKLKENDIPIIRARISAGEKYSPIADDFSVSVSTIHLIAKGRIWKQVTGAAWAVARTQHQAALIP